MFVAINIIQKNLTSQAELNCQNLENKTVKKQQLILEIKNSFAVTKVYDVMQRVWNKTGDALLCSSNQNLHFFY